VDIKKTRRKPWQNPEWCIPPEEAKRIKDKLEFQYTPKHGSRLNMAELELSVLNRQGLSRRIPRIDRMLKEAAAWNLKWNQEASKINR
jgi:hypothetical protein